MRVLLNYAVTSGIVQSTHHTVNSSPANLGRVPTTTDVVNMDS